jgi:hypothetical protein
VVNRRGAAVVIGRCVKTLENRASAGIGPRVIMIGGRTFYDYDELLAWGGHEKRGRLPKETHP